MGGISRKRALSVLGSRSTSCGRFPVQWSYRKPAVAATTMDVSHPQSGAQDPATLIARLRWPRIHRPSSLAQRVGALGPLSGALDCQ